MMLRDVSSLRLGASTPLVQPSAAASPSMSAEISFLTGINANGVVVPTSYWTWKNDKPATYRTHESYATKWGVDHASDNEVIDVNYFFKPQSNWTATEKGVIESCLALWSAVTNVHYTLVTHKADADMVFRRGSDGDAYEYDYYTGKDDAGTIGGTTLWRRTHATISIDTSASGFGPIDGHFTTDGGYVWNTIIHEIGHSYGLGHGGAYNGDLNAMKQQYSAYDSLIWTVMSYIEPHVGKAKYKDQYPVQADWGKAGGGFHNVPTTWMPLDIVAVQELYGKPLTTPLDGNQTFGFHCNLPEPLKDFFDFTVNVNPVITVYSAGNHNTLDLSGFKTASIVDLNPGTFSSCDGKTNNIAIAFDTVVETAIGGKAGDTLRGTERANKLVGNGGRDKLFGHDGHDVLNGNAGNDTLTGGHGPDAIRGGGGSDTVVLTASADSTGPSFDTVGAFDFADGGDRFDLPGTVTGIDPTVSGGALSKAHFNAELAAAVGDSELAAHHAVLFRPGSGQYAGDVFLIIDGNGTPGYQAHGDFVIRLVQPHHLADLGAGNFI